MIFFHIKVVFKGIYHMVIGNLVIKFQLFFSYFLKYLYPVLNQTLFHTSWINEISINLITNLTIFVEPKMFIYTIY